MLTLKQKKNLIQGFLSDGVSYDRLDVLGYDTSPNKRYSQTISNLLESIYLGTGKIPVLGESLITFADTDFPITQPVLPSLRFRDCPVSTIPGHQKDRIIFDSFYPALDDNIGMYFRVALAWLQESDTSRVPALLHIDNVDFDSVSRTKIYIPVITNTDTRMDIVAISYEAFVQLLMQLDTQSPTFYKFDPRGAGSLLSTGETLKGFSLTSLDSIRKTEYPAFYQKMITYIKTRHFSVGAYTCGQFILDIKMRK